MTKSISEKSVEVLEPAKPIKPIKPESNKKTNSFLNKVNALRESPDFEAIESTDFENLRETSK